MGQDDVFDEQSTSDGVQSKKSRKSRRSSDDASGIVTRLSKVSWIISTLFFSSVTFIL